MTDILLGRESASARRKRAPSPEVPAGWVTATLGEVAETSLGKMLDRSRGTGEHLAAYLRNLNVQWGRIDLDDVLQMDITPDERAFFRVRPGDLLVCEGGEVGRCAIWPGHTGYMAFQKALHRVRPRDGLDPRYLRYYFEHMHLSGGFAPYVTGTTIKHLPQVQLRRLPIALAPQAEQARIVQAIEDHLSRLDAAASNTSAAIHRARLLVPRYVDEALGAIGASTTLGALLREPLINGRSVPTEVGGFPVLRLTAIKDGRLDLTERKGGRWTRGDAMRYRVENGDFFVSRGNGSLNLVGRGALLVGEPGEIAFPDTMIRVRVQEQLMTPPFLRLVWNSRIVREQIERRARTTAGIYKVNQQILETILLPVPDVATQEEVVESVDQVRSTVAPNITAAEKTLTRSTNLRRSLLREAFAGRLVPQVPGDEPASVLLERTRREREAQPKNAKRDRRKTSAPQKEALL